MKPLSGQRFTVLSASIAAAYAGWLLRQWGADVHHVSRLDPEGAVAFFCEGAQFVAQLPLEHPGAETVITDVLPTAGNRAAVAGLAPATHFVWITPWGLESSWTSYPATELTLQAAGGWMAHVGEPDQEPLGAPNGQPVLVSGLYAAIAALSPRVLPGEQPHLTSVSMAEAVLATMIYDPISFQYLGVLRGRVGNRYSFTQPLIATLPCKDGHIGLHAALHRQWLRICELIGHPELPADPRFADPGDRARNVQQLDEEYLLPWLRQRTRFEAYHALQQAGIPCSPHPTMPEVLNSPQLVSREWWHSVRTPSGGEYRVPGPPYRIIAESEPAPAAGREAGPWKPGALRIVDLSMGWAGPLVSHILACHGADVIKVESHTHFDWWRGSRPPGDDPDLALYEHSHVFNGVNRGKRGITLDLATARGRELAIRLIDSADVVVENFAAGVIEKLGLTYDRLSATNPGLIMLRQPAFGSTGPESGYFAFGNTIEGISGLTALMGYEGGPPVMLANALGDPISGLNGVVGVLAALLARQRDGRGRCIEMAQVEAFLPMVAEPLIEYQRTGTVPARRGNRRPGATPSGAFRCSGDDNWVAIHVRDDMEWERLATVIATPWARAPRFATPGDRGEHRIELIRLLEEWTTVHDRDQLALALNAAGVPAAPVNNEADVLAFDPFASSSFFVAEDREHVGLHLYPGLPIEVDGERRLPGSPAPLLGQDNLSVLTAMGLSANGIAELRDQGIIGERAT